MKLALNIDKYGGSKIVPVQCGSSRGTAFFINSTQLLTAWHVVADHFNPDCNEAVSIKILGKDIPCIGVSFKSKYDISLLEVEGDFEESNTGADDDNCIPILSTDFIKDLELQIIGYPQEIGNGVDYFGVSVRNYRKLDDVSKQFDTMVIRTDQVTFSTYVGFSGSPVLNEFGSAIGVVTDQFHNSLGYTSIKVVEQELKDLRVDLLDCSEEQDTTQFGLGTCKKLMADSLLRAKSRFNKEFHIPNKEFELYIKDFCNLEISQDIIANRKEFKNWIDQLNSRRSPERCFDQLFPELMEYIERGLDNNEIGSRVLNELDLENEYTEEQKKKLREEVLEKFVNPIVNSKLIKLRAELRRIIDRNDIADAKFLKIEASAGTGKTHLLCKLGQDLCSQLPIYLFFGSQFRADEEPLTTISDILKWSDNDFEALNEQMEAKNKYAIFIIDALNEGVGTYFWKEHIDHLEQQFRNFKRLKLIVSIRKTVSSDNLNFSMNWKNKTLSGFENNKAAIQGFFQFYKINKDVDDYLNIGTLSNPLCLKIYCTTYYKIRIEERRKIDILKIYRKYIEYRNEEISRHVDEDPQLNVTGNFLYRLASRSLFDYKCADLDRREARRIANRLCHNRTWSNSLLYNALSSNLITEYRTTNDVDKITFEYDSMGDYLKVDRFISLKKSDREKLEFLKKTYAYHQQKYSIDNSFIKFVDFLERLFSLWNPEPIIWNDSECLKGNFTRYILNSFKYRTRGVEESTLSKDAIKIMFESNSYNLLPCVVLLDFNKYQNELIELFHENLMRKSMLARDTSWTVNLNSIYDSYEEDIFTSIKDVLETSTSEKLRLIVCGWLLTSSYPIVRNKVIRMIKTSLTEYPENSLFLIDKFHEVNDPYVLQGLYAAIYGFLLSSRNIEYAGLIAHKINEIHYSNDVAPSDLIVRSRTLKILEFAFYLDNSNTQWTNIKLPFVTEQDDPFSHTYSKSDFEKFFDSTEGGRALYRSLFCWDFNRYIIGTNSYSESKIFYKDKKNAISLNDIVLGIASIIKDSFGWNNELGDLDVDFISYNRMKNEKERIGKKYQWLGYYKVLAYLCDTCDMKINQNISHVGFADNLYPWYAGYKDSFDPSIGIDDESSEEYVYSFQESLDGLSEAKSPVDWLKDPSELPELYFIKEGHNEKEWVNIISYDMVADEISFEGGVDIRDQFIYYNSFFVEEDDAVAFEDWAKQQNFHGRWMPKNNGYTDFLWNEYPWSDSYKVEKNYMIHEPTNGCPCRVELSYSAQFQEDFEGLKYPEMFPATVYMPMEDIMNKLELYTAERGVIRSTRTGEIVAFNHMSTSSSLSGLFIARESLDEYLSKVNKRLYYCLLGEKELRINSSCTNVQFRDLTGCYQYQIGEGIKAVDSLRQIENK